MQVKTMIATDSISFEYSKKKKRKDDRVRAERKCMLFETSPCVFQGVLSSALSVACVPRDYFCFYYWSDKHGIMYIIFEVISCLKRRVQMQDNAYAR